MTTANTTLPAVNDLYTSRNVTVKLYVVPGGFIVGAGHLITGDFVIERMTDISDLMNAAARVEFAVRAAAM